MDIVFAFQQTANVSEENFRYLVEFSKDFVFTTHDIDTQRISVAAVSFPSATLVHKEFSPRDYHTRHGVYWKLDDIFNSVPVKGSKTYQTNVFDYISSNIEWREGPSMRRIALVLLTRSLYRNSKEAQQFYRSSAVARSRGVHVYVFAVGSNVIHDIPRLASHPWQANSLVLARYEQFERINPKSISLCRGVLHRPSATEGFQSKRDFMEYNKLLLINIDVHHGVGLTLENGFLYHRHNIPQRHLLLPSEICKGSPLQFFEIR